MYSIYVSLIVAAALQIEAKAEEDLSLKKSTTYACYIELHGGKKAISKVVIAPDLLEDFKKDWLKGKFDSNLTYAKVFKIIECIDVNNPEASFSDDYATQLLKDLVE